jgi:NADH-quinone oxidoreductase subunit L
MSTVTYGWLIVGFPLVGTIVLALGYRWLGAAAGWIASLAIGLAFASAVACLVSMLGLPEAHRELTSSLYNYDVGTGLDAKLGILVDPLSLFMCLVVSGVSTLIHIYSIAYVKSDEGRSRYFAFLNFFVFSMLVLVLAGNFLLLIVGWAFVGAASYLLISFWYRRTTATGAGIKAFVINVLGDVGLVLGTFFILRHTHTLSLLGTFAAAPHVFAHNSTDLVAGTLLLLVGAFAKSAQVPLHTWLPDAMEGPTPVSALIHAATMVTAGVYLIARMHPLFEIATTSADVGAIIGCATLVIAASIAVVQTDLKRVIAYSTMSQIGYMIMGVSVGAYAGGLFHLMTHAFFKALLFMGAGSVISAMGGEQSLDRMGGFRKAMPFTFICFIAGGLALSGVLPTAGWLSKDDILAYTIHRGGGFVVLGVFGYLGAMLTGVYTFRMIFRTFFGEPCPEAAELADGHLHHAEHGFNPGTGETEDTEVGFPGPDHAIAERNWTMKLPMSILAILAIVAGYIEIPGVDSGISRFLAPTFAGSDLYSRTPSAGTSWVGLIVGTLVGLAGISIAYVLYIRERGIPARLQQRLPAVHAFLYNKWYFDEAIEVIVVRPALFLGRFAGSTLENGLIGGGVTGSTTGLARALSASVRRAQTGFLRYYVALMIVGIGSMSLYFLLQTT